MDTVIPIITDTVDTGTGTGTTIPIGTIMEATIRRHRRNRDLSDGARRYTVWMTTAMTQEAQSHGVWAVDRPPVPITVSEGRRLPRIPL